jgi:Conserved mid region of cactin
MTFNPKQDDNFALLQSISRSKIRIREKRPEMFDLFLAVEQSLLSKEYFIGVKENLKGIDLEKIMSLKIDSNDLKILESLSGSSSGGSSIVASSIASSTANNEYWKSVYYLVNATVNTTTNTTTRDGVLSIVKTQMQEMFEKKTIKGIYSITNRYYLY